MAKQQIILLYGGRSAERKVSVLSAESVMRAIDYDKFFVKTYFITQAGDFIKTQVLLKVKKLNQVIFTKKGQLCSPFFMVQWEKMGLSKDFLKC